MNRDPGVRVTKAARSLVADRRGAIMVMGIPMCIFLVGALWYIAGVGDALVYRERMQEGADAVAFSTAVINARGMNVIVLVNLLMAAILAIRVAINLIKYTLIILAGIFDVLGDVPFLPTAIFFHGLELLAVEGAQAMQTADNVTRQPIDEALILLNKAETFVQYATPAGALGAAQVIAYKYRPTVKIPAVAVGSSIVGGTGASSWGLPVEKDSTSKLCAKAFDGVGGLLGSITPGEIGKKFMGMLKDLISGIGVSDVFCELSGGGTLPDLSGPATKLGTDRCKASRTEACGKAQTDQGNVDQKKRAFGYDDNGDPGPSTTATQVQQVTQLQAIADASQQQCDGLSTCEDDVKNKQGNGQSKAQQKVAAAGTGPANVQGDKTPSKVKQDWHNGIKDAQIASLVYSDTNKSNTTYSARFVSIGSRGNVTMSDPTFYQLISWAQAEFFYDCTGDWGTDSCNGTDDAMWNFHWRARFRLFNPDAFTGGSVISMYEKGLKAKIVVDGISRLSSVNLTNFQAKAELGTSVRNYPLTLH